MPDSGAEETTVLIQNMIRNIREKFDQQEIKATVGDFIRLLQLQRELADESPKEVEVRWVEKAEEEFVSER